MCRMAQGFSPTQPGATLARGVQSDGFCGKHARPSPRPGRREAPRGRVSACPAGRRPAVLPGKPSVRGACGHKMGPAKPPKHMLHVNHQPLLYSHQRLLQRDSCPRLFLTRASVEKPRPRGTGPALSSPASPGQGGTWEGASWLHQLVVLREAGVKPSEMEHVGWS